MIPLSKKFNLEHVHDELRREKANRQLKVSLNKGDAVPYFESEWGMAYTQQQQQHPERRAEMPSNSTAKDPAATCMSSFDTNSLHLFEFAAPSNPPETPTRLPLNSPIDPQRLAQNRKSHMTRSASTGEPLTRLPIDSSPKTFSFAHRSGREPNRGRLDATRFRQYLSTCQTTDTTCPSRIRCHG